jgi:hypothetical protein
MLGKFCNSVVNELRGGSASDSLNTSLSINFVPASVDLEPSSYQQQVFALDSKSSIQVYPKDFDEVRI